MKKLFSSALLLTAAILPTWADNVQESPIDTETEEPSGFLTSMLNNAMLKAMPEAPAADTEKPEYGRSVTKWASAPKLGGYAIGSYKYSDEKDKNKGDGFASRNIRLYIDGTLLNDFKYRVQFEFSGDKPHVKDYFLSWSHWKELEVKVGQFKRCFTFENPINPWDVGVGDFSQLVKKLAGMNDYTGADPSGNGGRDIGLQLQGDVLPVGQDKHRLFHYQVAVYNGQGINTKDINTRKDLIGTLQIQPIKDLYVGVFGWKGNVTKDGVTVNRDRYAIGAKYEHNGWSARAEYAHSTGHKISDFDKTNKTFTGNGRADAWYATVGVPCTPWLKVYAKYDAYRETASNNSLNSIYSLCPNFQLHKNLQLQLQYNYVHNKLAADRSHNEIWSEIYFRF